jgi:hypothetical protein
MAGSYKSGQQPSVSMKHDHQFLKKCLAPFSFIPYKIITLESFPHIALQLHLNNSYTYVANQTFIPLAVGCFRKSNSIWTSRKAGFTPISDMYKPKLYLPDNTQRRQPIPDVV